MSSGRAQDAWADLDEILKASPYTRFSLDTHRDWDNCRKRKWQAVLCKDNGHVLARAYGDTRDEAVAELVRAHHLSEGGIA
jgi:hypothetical protein